MPYFVRFVTPTLRADSLQEPGVFQAVFQLKDKGLLSNAEESHLDSVSSWFDLNLDKPDRFTSAKRPYYRKRQNGISWFKDSAKEHISKMWELVAILKEHEIKAEMIKTDLPGYILYEDEFQVVAVPFG